MAPIAAGPAPSRKARARGTADLVEPVSAQQIEANDRVNATSEASMPPTRPAAV